MVINRRDFLQATVVSGFSRTLGLTTVASGLTTVASGFSRNIAAATSMKIG